VRQISVINGDGASWIKEGTAFFPNCIYQYDRFHISRVSKERRFLGVGGIIYPDAMPHNADWTKKRKLDLLGITTLEQLLRFLAASGQTLEDFKKLPVYQWHKAHWDKIIEAGQT